MTAPVYPRYGKIRKPIIRDTAGNRQCTKCSRFLPEVAYPRDTPSNLGRDRQCKACHGMKETGETELPLAPTERLCAVADGDRPLYADPDPNPPPRLVLLGPWAGPESRCMVRAAPPTRLPRPPIAQRPMPVVRVQRRYAPNGMAIVDYDGVAWGTCSNHQHMRPLAEFYGPDRYGTMTLFRICAPCREQLRLRKREQRAQAKHQ
jgi:hypothetical protein